MDSTYEVPNGLSIEDLGFSLEDLRKSSLDDLARNGAKLIIETALVEEVLDFLGRDRYQHHNEDSPPGYLNGHRKRKVQLASGSIEVKAQKVTGAFEPFSSEVLPAFALRSKTLEEIIPLLYAEGVSTRDFKRALKPVWKGAGLSRSAVSRLNKQLVKAFKDWKRRDLSGEKIMYLFLDAVMLKVRIGAYPAEAVLAAHGIREDGSRVLLGLMLGGRESKSSWKAFIEDLASRGLAIPSLVISDGGKGLISAVKTVWPDVPRQRCIAHKIRNVLDRVPKKDHNEVKRAIHKIFYAPCFEEAKIAVDRFVNAYQYRFPTATETLCRDFYDCLTFYRFPEVHWKRIRTSNVIERAFREVRRRTNVIGRFPNELSALTLVFAVLDTDRLKWRGVKINDDIQNAVNQASCEVVQLMIPSIEKFLKAA